MLTIERRLVNARELGEYLGKSPEAIYQMVSRRQIPFVKMGGSTKFDLRVIDAWIKKLEVKPLEMEARESNGSGFLA